MIGVDVAANLDGKQQCVKPLSLAILREESAYFQEGVAEVEFDVAYYYVGCVDVWRDEFFVCILE